jgi:hypothetical protein
MRPAFLVIVIAVLVAIASVVGYRHWESSRALNNGAVVERQQPGDAAQQNQTAGSTATPPGQAGQSPQQPEASAQPQETIAELPGVDTIPRNPSERVIFAGKGRYQLYRQGDITWRLDTDNGEACILFATDVQWAKARVFEHGCATPQTYSR